MCLHLVPAAPAVVRRRAGGATPACRRVDCADLGARRRVRTPALGVRPGSTPRVVRVSMLRRALRPCAVLGLQP